MRPEWIVMFSKGFVLADDDMHYLIMPSQVIPLHSGDTGDRCDSELLQNLRRQIRCSDSCHASLSSQRHQLIASKPPADQSVQCPVHPIAMNHTLQKEFRPLDLSAVSTAPGAEPERTICLPHIDVGIDCHGSMTSSAPHLGPPALCPRVVIYDLPQ